MSPITRPRKYISRKKWRTIGKRDRKLALKYLKNYLKNCKTDKERQKMVDALSDANLGGK